MSVNVTHGSAVGTVHQEDKTVDQVVNVLSAEKKSLANWTVRSGEDADSPGKTWSANRHRKRSCPHP
jgi:hypothetical protein